MKRLALSFATVAALLLFTLVVKEEPAASQTPGKRPNIVYIVLDDASSNLLFQMPTIQNRMWKLGTRMPNSFFPVAWCSPSRATMLRGQYPHNHGVGTCRDEEARDPSSWALLRPIEDSTYATWLQDSGYVTGYIGKYINGYDNTTAVPPGWNYWKGWLGAYGGGANYRINENGTIRTYPRVGRRALHDTDYMSWRAGQYIRALKNNPNPWMLTVAPNAPHLPNWVPKRHRNAFKNAPLPKPPSFNEANVSDKGAYVKGRPRLTAAQVSNMEDRNRQRLRAMLSVDQMVANILNTLRDTRQMPNTYIVLWNDNGYHLGTHRLQEGKLFPYEEDVRYPMIVRGPGVPVGEARGQMVLGNDIAPTFADIADAETPDFVDGRSILPLLSKTPPESWRSAGLIHFRGENHPYAPPPYRAVRTNDSKYIEWKGGDREVYNILRDPFELNGDPEKAGPDRVAELEQRLRALENCAGESCRAAEDGE